ncbi:MAG TPA: nuclear transport factor 2 family protein [Spirochaetota bacterium]
MVTQERSEAFIKSWTGAWNNRDIEAVMSHFSDDIENSTPLVRSLLGIESGTINGAKTVSTFWKQIMDTYPEMSIRAIKCWYGIGLLSVHWEVITAKANGKTKDGNDTFFFNKDHKVYKVVTTHAV